MLRWLNGKFELHHLLDELRVSGRLDEFPQARQEWSDRLLLAVFNYSGQKARNASLKTDLDALGLVPKLRWQEFLRVRDLVAGEGEPKSRLDFYGRVLTVPALKPHTGRLISIRRY